MEKSYGHLVSEERAVLQIGISNGASIRSIPMGHSRSASTASRVGSAEGAEIRCQAGRAVLSVASKAERPQVQDREGKCRFLESS